MNDHDCSIPRPIKISPGQVFYDKLEDGLYEQCQVSLERTVVRSGRRFQAVPSDEVCRMTEEEQDGLDLIVDVSETATSGLPRFVFARELL